MKLEAKVHIYMNDPRDIARALRRVADDIENTHPSLLPCIYATGLANVAGFFSVSIKDNSPGAEQTRIVGLDGERLRAIAADYNSMIGNTSEPE